MRALLLALVLSVACRGYTRPLYAEGPPSTETQNGDCCCAVDDGAELADATACSYCIALATCESGEPPID